MNQAWSQFAHRPVPTRPDPSRPAPWNDDALIHRPDARLCCSVYLTPARRQEAADTSFRCVALFPAEPTFFFFFFFWPSEGKAALFNVTASHLGSLPLFPYPPLLPPSLTRSGRQNTLPGFYCCQQGGTLGVKFDRVAVAGADGWRVLVTRPMGGRESQ